MTENIKIIKRFSLPSTQSEAEKYIGKYPCFAVIARRQTGGRGRNGRSFHSNFGGLYMSLHLSCSRPAVDSTLFVIYAGLAVTRALEKQGINTLLKFPNDVKYQGKKLCGIICSSTLEGNSVVGVTAGIGININNKIPKELEDIAINLSDKHINRSKLIEDIIKEFYKMVNDIGGGKKLLGEYKEKSETIGHNVTVDCIPKLSGKAIDIDEKGFLLVECDGIIKKVSYGDVTRS